MKIRNMSTHERFVAKLQYPLRCYERKILEQQKKTKGLNRPPKDSKELIELLEEFFNNLTTDD